jgi:hypothetical protein
MLSIESKFPLLNIEHPVKKVRKGQAAGVKRSWSGSMKEPPDPGIRRLDVNVAASLWGSSAMIR